MEKWSRVVHVHASETRSVLRINEHKWLWRILRHEHFLHDIIERKVIGKCTWGRKECYCTRYNGREQLQSDTARLMICEKACQKPAGDSRRLKRKSAVWVYFVGDIKCTVRVMCPAVTDDPVACCVSMSVTRLRCAKTAEWIKVIFALEALEVLDGGPDSPMLRAGWEDSMKPLPHYIVLFGVCRA